MKKLLQAGRDDDNDGDDARLSVWLNRVKKRVKAVCKVRGRAHT